MSAHESVGEQLGVVGRIGAHGEKVSIGQRVEHHVCALGSIERVVAPRHIVDALVQAPAVFVSDCELGGSETAGAFVHAAVVEGSVERLVDVFANVAPVGQEHGSVAQQGEHERREPRVDAVSVAVNSHDVDADAQRQLAIDYATLKKLEGVHLCLKYRLRLLLLL